MFRTSKGGGLASPPFPFSHSGPVLVCGNAFNLHDDLARAWQQLPRAPVIAVNGAAGEVKAFALYSKHPEKMLQWMDRQRQFGDSFTVHGSKYKPDCLAVETQYVKKNVQSAIKLGMARGAVVIAAARRKVQIFEYAPTKAKLAVVGTGRASKQQVQGMVQRLLNLPTIPEPEDAADALALAICHAQAMHAEKVTAQEV